MNLLSCWCINVFFVCSVFIVIILLQSFFGKGIEKRKQKRILKKGETKAQPKPSLGLLAPHAAQQSRGPPSTQAEPRALLPPPLTDIWGPPLYRWQVGPTARHLPFPCS